MGYLFLVAELSWQSSVVPNSRQGYSGCRISNFPDGEKEECLHDRGTLQAERMLGAVLHDRSLAVSTGSGKAVSPLKLGYLKLSGARSPIGTPCLCDSLSVV